MNRPRLVFGVMSAGYRPAAVTELAAALAPYPVHVHHDFARYPVGPVLRSNMRLVANPARTGWGTWGFSTGIARLMRAVLDEAPFDYFQLLSPTCLPIRPLSEFAAYVAADAADAHLSVVDLFADEDARIEYGFRTFVPGSSIRKRLLGRARHWSLGAGRRVEQRSGLAISRPDEGHRRGLVARGARALMGAARRGYLGRHPFGPQYHPYMGSTWLGARPPVLEYLVSAIAQPRIAQYFARLDLTDELLLATLLGNSAFRLGPLNHLINRYSLRGNPEVFVESDLPAILASDRFFARKFSDHPDDPVRRAVLARLGADTDGKTRDHRRFGT